MGRPPLNVIDLKIRVSPGTRERIKSLVGNYGISSFIREAIERELIRREGMGGEPSDLNESAE